MRAKIPAESAMENLMASCPKCARRRIRKSRDGLRWCRRCGCLPNQMKLLRDGTKRPPAEGKKP